MTVPRLRDNASPPSPDGIRIRIAHSKTDQHGHGHELLVVYAESPRPCPVRPLRAWIDGAEITSGAIFRRVTRTGAVSSPLTPQTVALNIEKRARAPGSILGSSPVTRSAPGTPPKPPATAPNPTQIAATTRHQDQRVLAGYIRAGRGRDDIAHVL
jgi:hypothetical protein